MFTGGVKEPCSFNPSQSMLKLKLHGHDSWTYRRKKFKRYQEGDVSSSVTKDILEKEMKPIDWKMESRLLSFDSRFSL